MERQGHEATCETKNNPCQKVPSSRTGTARGQGPMAGNSGLSPQLSEQREVRWIRWYWSRAEWCGFLDGDMPIGEWRTTCYHRRTGAGATQTEALTKDTRYVTARGKLTMPGVWRWRVGGYLEMMLWCRLQLSQTRSKSQAVKSRCFLFLLASQRL